MPSRAQEAHEKRIAQSVIESLDDKKLLESRDFLKKFMEYRGYKKLYTTYINGVSNALEYNGDGKIYVQYNLDGTTTGRLSNSSYTGDNGKKMGISFHTLPREAKYNIRNYVVAPKGYKFITADVKSMELRIMAHLSKDTNMVNAFNDKVDLHRFSGSLTFGKPPEKVTAEERQIAKEVSFLTIYGGTAATLSKRRGIPIKKAERIINSWMDGFPGVANYIQKVHSFIYENGYAYTIFGRRRNLPNIRAPQRWIMEGSLRQGLNFTVQSAASDTIVSCIIGLDKRLKESGLDAKIVATVHDSIELVAKEDHVDETLDLLFDEMVNYPYVREMFGLEFIVPLEIEVLVGESFGAGEEVIR